MDLDHLPWIFQKLSKTASTFLSFLPSSTLGELKLSKIQKNVKQNIQDNISLFSLGIGFDVDYDFLKRLSNDNRGIAQRIYGNQDTSSQLKVITWFSVLFFLLYSKSFNWHNVMPKNKMAEFKSKLSFFQRFLVPGNRTVFVSFSCTPPYCRFALTVRWETGSHRVPRPTPWTSLPRN